LEHHQLNLFHPEAKHSYQLIFFYQLLPAARFAVDQTDVIAKRRNLVIDDLAGHSPIYFQHKRGWSFKRKR
jgi:hypothetical protein